MVLLGKGDWFGPAVLLFFLPSFLPPFFSFSLPLFLPPLLSPSHPFALPSFHPLILSPSLPFALLSFRLSFLSPSLSFFLSPFLSPFLPFALPFFPPFPFLPHFPFPSLSCFLLYPVLPRLLRNPSFLTSYFSSFVFFFPFFRSQRDLALCDSSIADCLAVVKMSRGGIKV